MSDERAPPKPSDLACWIYDHGPISGIQVDYRPTGVDTAETVVILTGWQSGAKPAVTRECRPEELNAVAFVGIGFNRVADLRDGQRQQVEAYRAFMKRHQRELADYRRLRAKFGDLP